MTVFDVYINGSRVSRRSFSSKHTSKQKNQGNILFFLKISPFNPEANPRSKQDSILSNFFKSINTMGIFPSLSSSKMANSRRGSVGRSECGSSGQPSHDFAIHNNATGRSSLSLDRFTLGGGGRRSVVSDSQNAAKASFLFQTSSMAYAVSRS